MDTLRDDSEQRNAVTQAPSEEVRIAPIITTLPEADAHSPIRYEEINAQIMDSLSSNTVNATILSIKDRKARQFEALGAEYAYGEIDRTVLDEKIKQLEANSELRIADIVTALGGHAFIAAEDQEIELHGEHQTDNQIIEAPELTTVDEAYTDELILPVVDSRPEYETDNDFTDLEQEEFDYINDVLRKFDEQHEFDDTAETFQPAPEVHIVKEPVDAVSESFDSLDEAPASEANAWTEIPTISPEVEPIVTEPSESAVLAETADTPFEIGTESEPVISEPVESNIVRAEIYTETEPAPALSYELLPTDKIISLPYDKVAELESAITEEVESTSDELPEEIFEPEAEPFKTSEYALDTEEAYIVVSVLNKLADKIYDAGIRIKNTKLENKLARKAKLPKTDKTEFARRQQVVLEKFFTAVEQGDEFSNLDLIDETNQSNLMFTFVDYIGDINDQVRDRSNWRVVREIVEANIENPDHLETGTVVAPSISVQPERENTRDETELDQFRNQTKKTLATLESENAIQNGSVSFDTVQTIIDRDDMNVVTLAKDLIDKGIITLDVDKRVISLKDALLILSIAKTTGQKEPTTAFIHSAEAIAQEEITQFHEFRKMLGDDNQFALAA